MVFYLQALIDGVLLGGIYALAAMGVSLIFGVMRVSNFAHGSLIAMGMYVAFQMGETFGTLPYVALPVVVIVLFALGFIIERFFIFRVASSNVRNQLMMTMGFSILLENTILGIWKGNYRMISVDVLPDVWRLGPIVFNAPRLVSFFFVIIVTLCIYLLLYKTDLGKGMRAASMDKDGAALAGVNIRTAYATAYGIGAACAGIAGALLTPTMYFYPAVGSTLQLKCIVVAVLGSLGNIWGSLVGGLIIGVIGSVASFALGGTWSDMVVYGIFVLILMVKPTGLFGKR